MAEGTVEELREDKEKKGDRLTRRDKKKEARSYVQGGGRGETKKTPSIAISDDE